MVMSASAPTGSRGTPGGPGLPSEFLNSVKGGGWGVRQANLGNFLKIPGIFFFNKNSHKKNKEEIHSVFLPQVPTFPRSLLPCCKVSSMVGLEDTGMYTPC